MEVGEGMKEKDREQLCVIMALTGLITLLHGDVMLAAARALRGELYVG